MTFPTSLFWRVIQWSVFLTVLAIAFVAFKGAKSETLHVNWQAPMGLDQAQVSPDDLAVFLSPASGSGTDCKGPQPLALDLDRQKPTKAFEFTLTRSPVAGGHQVVYLQDPIAETVVFTALDAAGCRWTAAAGRAFPFAQRAFPNPFPNVLLPEHLPTGTVVQVLIQDGKSIRPWVYVEDAGKFQQLSTTIWMCLTTFAALLLAAAFIAAGFTGLQRQTVVWAFVVYAVCFLFWLNQNFSLASAGLGHWPQGRHFPAMQAMAVASVVLGIGMASVEFLQLETRAIRALRWGVAICAAAFLSSAWLPFGYKTGSAILAVVALSIAWTLIRKLRKADLPLKLFALGLTAAMAGGALQAASVVMGGGTSGYWPIFAFPLGAFFQGIFWLAALLVRSEQNRRTQEAKLVHDATFDALTGLYNRPTFTHQLSDRFEAIRQGASNDATLIFLGLDRFKLVNDSLGHLVGDELLRQVAGRLRSAIGPTCTIGRFSGDEYLVLYPNCRSDTDAQSLALHMLSEFKRTWNVLGRELTVSASMGVVRITRADASISDLLRDADTALHRAKANGRNQFVLFDQGMRQEVELRFRIESELSRAIETRQFELHFQPIVTLADGSHAGFEALVRWNHPVHGLISPAQFISIAEESGHICALGHLIIDMALSDIADWKAAGVWRPGWYVSINVSGGQLVDHTFIRTLDELLSHTGVAEQDIRLELTETAVISNLEVANDIFPKLRKRGVALCMDDFGTGHSSLSNLSELPFQVIKIDKSFVDGITHLPQQRALIKAMLSMAHELGMRVVAEGIETAEQAETLRLFGCDFGQGNHFARALPLEQATQWMANRLA